MIRIVFRMDLVGKDSTDLCMNGNHISMDPSDPSKDQLRTLQTKNANLGVMKYDTLTQTMHNIRREIFQNIYIDFSILWVSWPLKTIYFEDP